MSFISQQRREADRIAGELSDLDPDSEFRLSGAELDWTATGHHVERGEHFRLQVSGHIWVVKPLSVGMSADQLVWVRIGGTGPFYRMLAEETEFQAWQRGEVEIILKGLSYWADADGSFLPGSRKRAGNEIGVSFLTPTGVKTASGAPKDWVYHWQLGDAQIYTPYDQTPDAAGLGALNVDTHGDVGIICRDCEQPLTPETRLSWSWLVEQLPSDLAEDLTATHDYLSMAVEFDNGLDLSYIWSAQLPQDHVFQCPLDYWCDYETHWVLRSGHDELGKWHAEERNLWEDYALAIGEQRPQRVVKVWLIANSLFQRRRGLAHFKDIALQS